MPRNPSHELAADAARRIADTYIGRSEQAWRVPANEAPAQDERVPRPPPITPIEYIGLQRAFDFFNVMLFEEGLPDVMMTLQKRAGAGGYFSPDRFIERTSAQTKQHELALNPDSFTAWTDEFIASVLVHEMVHLWQHTYGKRLRPGYHDQQWGAKMKELGLYPSSTGAVGGKETGYAMQHYIVPGGAFQQAFQTLAASGWKPNIQSEPGPGQQGPTPRTSKHKFTCPRCGQNCWGARDLKVKCGDCDLRMINPTAGDAFCC